jgi:hypothetical protein
VIFSRRRQRSDPGTAIAAFWQWWPPARPRVEEAIQSGGWGNLTEEIASRIEAVHPGLQWEFAAGAEARHALVVSPGGSAELRALAARWLAGAPRRDGMWEFHSSRQPDPAVFEATMSIAGRDVRLAELRYSVLVDPQRHQLDVSVHHPLFGELPEEVANQVAFLSLDWALGEEGVERWVGPVSAGGPPPPGAWTVGQLRETARQLADEHTEPEWALMSAEDATGRPIIATAQQPLLPVRWPRFDTHVAVTLPYQLRNEGDLPVDASLVALRDLEDRLVALLGDDGDLLAHETTRGRRTMHFYVDGVSAAADRIDEQVRGWREGQTSIRKSYDPSLEGVAHLRV